MILKYVCLQSIKLILSTSSAQVPCLYVSADMTGQVPISLEVFVPGMSSHNFCSGFSSMAFWSKTHQRMQQKNRVSRNSLVNMCPMQLWIVTNGGDSWSHISVE